MEREVLDSSSLYPVIGHMEMAENCIHRRFRVDIRKHFFTKTAGRLWNRLPREAVNAPYKPVVKRHSDNALKNML